MDFVEDLRQSWYRLSQLSTLIQQFKQRHPTMQIEIEIQLLYHIIYYYHKWLQTLFTNIVY